MKYLESVSIQSETISHWVAKTGSLLEDATKGYKTFAEKKDGCIKVV